MLATVLYLLFLFAPIALLAIGSVGGAWTNTLLPTGFTTEWYAQLAADPSFRRAFLTSLKVVALTCIIDTLIALPLAYAIHASARRGVKVAARVVTLLPIATPELVLGFGFILVFSSDAMPWLGSIWLLAAAHVV
ncbi:ABC transporter permease [Xanthobacteraceae bacterium A53D]